MYYLMKGQDVKVSSSRAQGSPFFEFLASVRRIKQNTLYIHIRMYMYIIYVYMYIYTSCWTTLGWFSVLYSVRKVARHVQVLLPFNS